MDLVWGIGALVEMRRKVDVFVFCQFVRGGICGGFSELLMTVVVWCGNCEELVELSLVQDRCN